MATSNTDNPCSVVNCEDDKAVVIASLEKLKDTLDDADKILEIFHPLPFTCLSENTKINLCYRLDNPSEIPTDNGRTKDYLGIAEWADLERVFIRYLSKTECRYKTIEVLAKWSTEEKAEPKPNLGNLQRCLCGEDGIDREDVVTDMAKMINKDAFKWQMEKYRANTAAPVEVDDSWQLTRQDVITGKKTYYTACLVYADEDVEMAEVINTLYQSVYPSATFFRPQFDMKRGRYELETTARVIQERCGGKTIFLLSEYFLANEVCQFAVNFAATVCRGAGVGNLIPFHLSPNNDHVPPVLRGIAGIRWFRREVRKYAWHMVTETILVNQVQQSELEPVLKRIDELVQSKPSQFLSDPKYDEGLEPPGAPIEIEEPEGMDEILKKQHRCIPPISSPETESTDRGTSFSRIKSFFKNTKSKIKQKFSSSSKTCKTTDETANNSAENNSRSSDASMSKNASQSQLNDVGAELAEDVLEDLSHVFWEEQTQLSQEERPHVHGKEQPHVSGEEQSHESGEEHSHLTQEVQSHVSGEEQPLVSEDHKPHVPREEQSHVTHEDNPHVTHKYLSHVLKEDVNTHMTREVSGTDDKLIHKCYSNGDHQQCEPALKDFTNYSDKDKLISSGKCNDNTNNVIPMNLLSNEGFNTDDRSDLNSDSLKRHNSSTIRNLPLDGNEKSKFSHSKSRNKQGQNENSSEMQSELSEPLHSNLYNTVENPLKSSTREPTEHEEETFN